MKSGLARESKNRTRSERNIDKLVSNEDIQAVPIKRIKIEEGKSQVSQLSSSQAFDKIKKCLNQTHRIQKTVPVLVNFLKRYYARIPIEQVFECVHLIFSSEFSQTFPIPALSDLILTIEELYPDIPVDQQSYFKSCKEISDTFNNVFTDDSIEFHKVLRKIENSMVKFQDHPELPSLFGRSLKCLFPFIFRPWSRSSVKTFFQGLYVKRSIFEEPVQELINKALDSQTTQSLTQEIKTIGTPSHLIQDNRVTVTITDSQDSWAHKQSGLKK